MFKLLLSVFGLLCFHSTAHAIDINGYFKLLKKEAVFTYAPDQGGGSFQVKHLPIGFSDDNKHYAYFEKMGACDSNIGGVKTANIEFHILEVATGKMADSVPNQDPPSFLLNFKCPNGQDNPVFWADLPANYVNRVVGLLKKNGFSNVGNFSFSSEVKTQISKDHKCADVLMGGASKKGFCVDPAPNKPFIANISPLWTTKDKSWAAVLAIIQNHEMPSGSGQIKFLKLK
jgi:hypothetical protein